MTIKRALLSVSDKSGLLPLAEFLVAQGVELVSTGGTAKALADAGLPVTLVTDVTGQPEILGGRVKTLHPRIHAGLLADQNNSDHMASLSEAGIDAFELVVVNLYPFRQTLASGADFTTCIENIDIGGPAMLRASAKNHASVLVVTDPEDYPMLQAKLTDQAVDTDLRRRMALKAFSHTAAYDADISAWLLGQTDSQNYPEEMSFAGKKIQDLRYGENPHQSAAWYQRLDGSSGLADAKLAQGKALSYNNINDGDAALAQLRAFNQPAAVIVKHANPCGVAVANDPLAAYKAALASDPTSAFGGIVAINRALDQTIAEAIVDIFTEIVIAPAADQAALEIFAKKANLRLMLLPSLDKTGQKRQQIKDLSGGFLVQSPDTSTDYDLKVVTKRAPSTQELSDLEFGFKVAKQVKSNAIVLTKDGATVGVGAGQMSRVDAARIAGHKAGKRAAGSVLASDAFFPFADGVQMAIDAGATAIIQPGGSMRDEEVIAAADKAGLAMVFTGIRHFNH